MALEAFSIREYAANMRGVDLHKCWPFKGSPKLLPHISVKKFQFWADQLQITVAPPIDKEEERNGEILLIETQPKKQRAPKKRSISEISAVAPPLAEKINNEKEVKEEEKRGKIQMWKKSVKGEITMKRKKKKPKLEICATKKEKIKRPTSSAHTSLTLQDSNVKLLARKNNNLSVDTGEMPVDIKNLPKNHKLKLVKSSKPISKKKMEFGKILEADGILKNSTRDTANKAGAETNKKGRNVAKSGGESEKHATYNGKDDMLGHTKCSSSIDIPQLRNLCKTFSDVLAVPSASDDTANAAHKETASDMNVVRNVTDKIKETSSEKEQLSETHSDLMPPIYKHPCAEICSDTERSSSFVQETSTLLSSERHFDDPSGEGRSSSHSDKQAKETSVDTSNSRSLTGLIVASRYDATDSLSFDGKQSPQKSISCSKDLAEGMHSSMKPKPVPNPMPTYKEKLIRDGFVGLPLNSQGELIHLHSGAERGFHDLIGWENAARASNSIYSVPKYAEHIPTVDPVRTMKGKFTGASSNQNDHSSCFQKQHFLCNKPPISGNGFTNFPSLSFRDQIFLYDPNPMEISCYKCDEDNHTRNFIDMVNIQAKGNMNHAAQPNNIRHTMRLMGTDVTIVENNKGCQSYYNDRRVCHEKGILTDNYPSVRVPERPLPQQMPFDVSSNLYRMPPIARRTGLKIFDYNQPQLISSRNGNSSINFGHHIPMTSNPYKAYECTFLNSTHCKHTQGIAYNTISSLHTPFWYHETSAIMQQSPENSSPILPQWLFNAKQQKTQEPFCSCYSNHATKNFFPVSTPSSIQSSFISELTTRNSRAQVDNYSTSKIKNIEGAKFYSTYLRCSGTAGKTRKRSSAKDDGFMKPAKKPSPRM